MTTKSITFKQFAYPGNTTISRATIVSQLSVDNQSISDNNTTTESGDVVVGALLLCTTSASLIAHCLFLAAVFRQPRFYRNSCYQIMISLAFSDMLALISWSIIGAFVLTGETLRSVAVETSAVFVIIGAWRNVGWHQALLALNRYTIICRRVSYSRLFRPAGVAIMLSISWLHSAVFASPTLISPRAQFNYNGYYIWFPHSSICLFYVVEDESFSLLLILVAIVCYALVIKHYREVIYRVSSHNINSENAELSQKMRLAWQVLTVTLLYTGCAMSFYLVLHLKTDVWVSFVFSTYFTALNNAVSPFIYLTLNRQLQLQLLQWFGLCRFQCLIQWKWARNSQPSRSDGSVLAKSSNQKKWFG